MSSAGHLSLTESRWADMRRTERVQTSQAGRLGYGGREPGIINCQILDVSEFGVRVEIYESLDPMPEFFSIEFGEVYCRARRSWTKSHEVGLEFIFDAAKPVSGNPPCD
jgi:hypothetical protein